MGDIRRCSLAQLSLQALMSHVHSISAMLELEGLIDPRRSLDQMTRQRSSLKCHPILLRVDRKPVMY